MRFYNKKILSQMAAKQAERRTEIREAMIWDILPDQKVARVRIQGTNTFVIAHYPRNCANAPSWLVPGMAVKIGHPTGTQGWIELLEPGAAMPTPISGASLPTLPNPSNGVVSGGELYPSSVQDLSAGDLDVEACAYIISGITYNFPATSVFLPPNPPAHNFRYDIVVADSSETLSVIEGVEATSGPVVPEVPAGSVMIGQPILRYHMQENPIPPGDIGRVWEAPRPISVSVTAMADEMYWWDFAANIITATVMNQYSETITPAEIGYSYYTFTLEWLSGNGSIDSTPAPTSVEKDGLSDADYDQTFEYTRENLIGDASPIFKISVNSSPVIFGVKEITLYSEFDLKMYGAGAEPFTITPAGSVTVDWSTSHMQVIEMDQNTEFTFEGGQPLDKLILIISTNGFTPTFPASVHYSTDIPESIISQLSSDGKYDYLGFIFHIDHYDLVAVTRGFTGSTS